MYRIFDFGSLAFDDREPSWTATWSRHWKDAGRVQGGQRMETVENTDPHTTFLEAVDAASSRTPGMGLTQSRSWLPTSL